MEGPANPEADAVDDDDAWLDKSGQFKKKTVLVDDVVDEVVTVPCTK